MVNIMGCWAGLEAVAQLRAAESPLHVEILSLSQMLATLFLMKLHMFPVNKVCSPMPC